MCGIVGAYHLRKGGIDPRLVLRSAHLMRHRGPDGEGYLLLNTDTGAHSLRNGPDTPANIHHPAVEATWELTPDLVLGHRRLAILDLSPGGHEPMTVAGETCWITFNGEIYNYLELRAELRSLGYEFHTESDVEVLLQAYAAWGIGCLERFIGMFAFALWDQTRQRLFCARDRLGVKPFYYAVEADTFAFASEMKALRPLAPAAATPDLSQLFWYLHFGRVYNAPHTFFEGIRELPGGHYLLIEAGVVGEPVRWWDVDLERAQAVYNYERPDVEFLRLLQDSVTLRLRSDVPVGTCLSGGLDSSAIVALAARQLVQHDPSARMNSFSALYPVKGMDESHFVNIMVGHSQTIRHDVTPRPDGFLEQMQRITWHQDIPTASPTVFSQYAVMRLAHDHVTVLLDGQGADELMAGYLSHVVFHLKALLRQDPIRWLPQQAAFIVDVWPRFNASLNWREFGFRALRYLSAGVRPLTLLQPDREALALERQSQMSTVTLAGADALNQHLYKELIRDSIPSLLHYEDRNSMAYSIEARVPFLDHRLVEFALGVPAALKVRGPQTKVLMRQALRGVLPPEIVDRKDKLGYPTPFSQWLRGPLQDDVNTFLEDRVFRRDWYDRDHVRDLWRAHRAGERNMSQIIHRLISADLWYEQQRSDARQTQP